VITTKTVAIWSKELDTTFEGQLTIATEPPWTLQLTFADRSILQTDTDLFRSLAKIREELEKENMFLLCQGSRINIRPSAMFRDAIGGVRAYVLTMGQPGKPDQMADIFDPILPDEVATVEEQDRFYEAWLKSLQ
jgi:hypothetical protein